MYAISGLFFAVLIFVVAGLVIYFAKGRHQAPSSFAVPVRQLIWRFLLRP
jgi:hypothetical protein